MPFFIGIVRVKRRDGCCEGLHELEKAMLHALMVSLTIFQY